MTRVKWLLEFLFVVLFTLPLAVLPYKIALKTGESLGRLLFFSWGSRREIALGNLRDAVSRGSVEISASPEEIIKRHFMNLGRSFAEVIKIFYGLGGKVLGQVRIKGIEHFRKAHDKGAGVIFITGHCGNWELNATAFAVNLGKMNVVARPVDNPYLNRFLEWTRKKYGNGVIYKKGALRQILTCLRNNEVVAILMDQSVVRSEGVMAEFLGKMDYTTKMPAIIARKTGAPVLPGFIRRVDGGHLIEIGAEIELDRSEDYETAVYNDTVNFSSRIEEYIRQNPDEWLWIHRRWKRMKKKAADPHHA